MVSVFVWLGFENLFRHIFLKLVPSGMVLEDFHGEFDPGSGRTLAACLTHASRTERPCLQGTRVANG